MKGKKKENREKYKLYPIFSFFFFIVVLILFVMPLSHNLRIKMAKGGIDCGMLINFDNDSFSKSY